LTKTRVALIIYIDDHAKIIIIPKADIRLLTTMTRGNICLVDKALLHQVIY